MRQALAGPSPLWPRARSRSCVRAHVLGGRRRLRRSTRATGRIVSNFLLADTGDVTDHVLGVIFVRESASGWAAAKLDGGAVHDRVFGVVERPAIVPAVDGKPDRAGIDVDRLPDACSPLEVRVPAGE